MKLNIFLTLSLILPLSQLESQEREWTSSDGRTLTAELLSATPTTVKLLLANGSTVDVPISRFSVDDQTFVNEWRRKADTIPQSKLISLKVQNTIRDDFVGLSGGSRVDETDLKSDKPAHVGIIFTIEKGKKPVRLVYEDDDLQFTIPLGMR